MPLASHLGAFRSVTDKGVDVDRLRAQANLARLHPVEVQHLPDHPVQPLGIAVDVVGQSFDLVRTKAVVQQDLAEALDSHQGGAELVADHGDELALELIEALEAGEVGHGRLFGLVLCSDVLEHREKVLDATVGLTDRRHAPVQPDLAAVGTENRALAFERIDVSVPQGLPELEKAGQLLCLQVLRHHRADHHPRRRKQQRTQPGVGVEYPHVDADPCHPEWRVGDDLVEDCGSLLQLRLGVVALGQLSQRVLMQHDHARHEENAETTSDRRLDPVQALATGGLAKGHHGCAQKRYPRNRHLPQVGRTLPSDRVAEGRGPEWGKRDQQVADHPTCIKNASRRAIAAGCVQIGKCAVGDGVGRQTGDQEQHQAALVSGGAPEHEQQDGDDDDVTHRIGGADQLRERIVG